MKIQILWWHRVWHRYIMAYIHSPFLFQKLSCNVSFWRWTGTSNKCFKPLVSLSILHIIKFCHHILVYLIKHYIIVFLLCFQIRSNLISLFLKRMFFDVFTVVQIERIKKSLSLTILISPIFKKCDNKKYLILLSDTLSNVSIHMSNKKI